MRMFDVQGIEIHAPRGKVFEFLREPSNLPQWSHAFVSAGLKTAGTATGPTFGLGGNTDSAPVDESIKRYGRW